MSNVIPENIHFLQAAQKEFLTLDGHQKRLVVKALNKIAKSPNAVGKHLGRRGGSDLTGFRSVSVDKQNLRIVWSVTSAGTVEVALVIAVGPRGDEEVYIIAARRRVEALASSQSELSRLERLCQTVYPEHKRRAQDYLHVICIEKGEVLAAHQEQKAHGHAEEHRDLPGRAFPPHAGYPRPDACLPGLWRPRRRLVPA